MNGRTPLPQGHLLQRRYRIERLLSAEGGLSLVYLATCSGRSWVIKETYDADRIQRDAASTSLRARQGQEAIHQRQIQRAREEWARAAELRHPGIVEIVDGFDANGTFYLVMPFVAGHDLSQEVGLRRFEREEAVRLAGQALGALAFLHGRGIVHRDIKPDNLWRREGDGQLMLLDTGAAREFGNDVRKATFIETPFGAPELRGSFESKRFGPVGPGTDLFALAGVMAVMLSGRDIPQTDERMAALMQPQDPLDNWVLPASAGGEPVAAVLRRALSLHIDRRHASVDEFQRELQSALAGMPAVRHDAPPSRASASAPARAGDPASAAETGVPEPPKPQGLAWLLAFSATVLVCSLVALLCTELEPLLASMTFLLLHASVALGLTLAARRRGHVGANPWHWMPLLNLLPQRSATQAGRR